MSEPSRKREILIKGEEPLNPEYGVNPYERPIQTHIKYGVINLDKTPGPTSHEITSWVKRILNVKKAGHAGTLEPLKWGGETRMSQVYFQ
jgi:H/ACA ribonucleoprotein complex subunit 4